MSNVFIFFFSLSLGANVLAASGENKTSETRAEGFNSVDMIMHHIADSHEWHLWGEGKSSFTIPLPVILLTERGLVTFMSSEFHHNNDGTYVVDQSGSKFVKFHEKIYQLKDVALKALNDYKGDESFWDAYDITDEDNAIKPDDFSITKNAASLFISFILLIVLFGRVGIASRKNHGAPKGLASFLEPLVVFVRDDIVRPNIGSNYLKYLPYLLTLFFFILVNNLLGLLPGGANVTGNMAITLILAFITLLVTNISGNRNYWSHIFKPPGVPLLLMPIMIPIEFVGIFTKPIALMIRLFANISAGHIVILSLLSLIFMAQSGLGTVGAYSVAPISVIFVLFMYLIECLVAFLQAYIFTLLTSLFIGLATTEHH